MKPKLTLRDLFWLVLGLSVFGMPNGVADDSLSDDERLKLLKPRLTLEQAEAIIKGKRSTAIGCGPALTKQEDGEPLITACNSYVFKSTARKEFLLCYTYWSEVGLARIEGPGFRYVRQGDKFYRRPYPMAFGRKKAVVPEE